MVELKIRKEALQSALEASRNAYPSEFIGLFRGKKEGAETIAEELILAPLATYERNWSAYSDWNVPLNMGIVASFHSHPNSVPKPSRQDLHFFARTAPYHFIAASPYGERNARAYDRKGKPVEFALV